ncbi:MAG TPA: hypothetical protein PLZ55_06830 [bacterium]|nr:hypothetical protein [bacterium]
MTIPNETLPPAEDTRLPYVSPQITNITQLLQAGEYHLTITPEYAVDGLSCTLTMQMENDEGEIYPDLSMAGTLRLVDIPEIVENDQFALIPSLVPPDAPGGVEWPVLLENGQAEIEISRAGSAHQWAAVFELAGFVAIVELDPIGAV